MQPVPTFLILSALVFLAACAEQSSSPAEEDTVGFLHIGTYAADDSVVITQIVPDTAWLCEDGVRIQRIRQKGPDTAIYRVQDDRLRIWGGYDTVPSSTPSRAILRRFTEFARISTGPGIRGGWRYDTSGFEVQQGSLLPEELRRYHAIVEKERQENAYVARELLFGQKNIYRRETGRFAELFAARWNRLFDEPPFSPANPDSAWHDIDVTVLGAAQVRLKGRKTGETVLLEWIPPANSRRFSSDNPEHPPYDEANHLLDLPCFERQRFGWYEAFLSANRRGDPSSSP